jgi:hypothetical protein
MASVLQNSPAEIVRQLMVLENVGTLPDASGEWPIYVANEPTTPDNCITVRDTAGVSHGRSMPDNALLEHFGIQVRVRAATHSVGWPKANAVRLMLKDVYCAEATVDGVLYRVHALVKIGQILALGKEAPMSKRSIFTINMLVSLRADGSN